MRAALADMRFEFAVVLLLILTIGAIRYGETILTNSVVISAEDPSVFTIEGHGDEAMGGASTISANPKQPLIWSCALRPKYQYPFCGYEVIFDKYSGRGIDLSKYQTITLNIDYQGPADSIRLYLKNFDARYSNPKVRETVKFNQVELPIGHQGKPIQVHLSDFNVAEWWIQKNRIPFRFSRPQFDNVVGLEIDTGNSARTGNHQFRIRSIALHGSSLSIEQWYLGILGCWIVLICLFLISRILDLQRDLKRRRQQQDMALGEAQRAQEFARRDHLTGLLNRLGITDCYQQLIAAGASRPVAIMLIDVDHFKSINDRFGHTRGDEVLSAFAQVLRNNTRDDDLIGRWGGEEFLLIGRVSDEVAALEIANKLRAVVEKSDFGGNCRLTASFGVYYCDSAPGNLGSSVSCADRALYDAKEQGRNRVVQYHPPADVELPLRPDDLASLQPS